MATRTKNISVESRFATSELVQKSNYIQDRCVNEQWKTKEGKPLHGWWHGVPLKSVYEHYLSPDNWALDEDEIMRIQTYTGDLQKYALFMVDLEHQKKKPELKQHLKSVTTLLPPWIVFPLYHASSQGWKQESGAEYLLMYQKFCHSLTPEEKNLYQQTYPLPCYLATWEAP